MDIQDILSASIEEPESILNLPYPEFSPIETASMSETYEVCREFLRIWKELLITGHEVELNEYEVRSPDGDSRITLEGEEVWDYLLLLVAAYYDFALKKYLAFGTDERKTHPPGITFAAVKDFIPKCADLNPKIAFLMLVTHHYFSSVLTIFLLDLLHLMPVPFSPIAEVESQLHAHFHEMFEMISTIRPKYLRIFGARLMDRVLEYAKEIYEKEKVYNLDHMPGPFSSIRLSELGLLANRDESLIHRYGEGKIARIFEHQLALIAQSFGLHVVSTRAGRKTVDLVCISGLPDERTTFLIEAKTSKRSYYLPKKDARALREYVEDVKGALLTLPPLSFVLLLGPNPSSTLPDKINTTQSQIGLPVRYCTAQQFADLRERLPGPLPMRIFVNQILTGSLILSDEFVTKVVEAQEAEQEAHSRFVEAMFSAKGII